MSNETHVIPLWTMLRTRAQTNDTRTLSSLDVYANAERALLINRPVSGRMHVTVPHPATWRETPFVTSNPEWWRGVCVMDTYERSIVDSAADLRGGWMRALGISRTYTGVPGQYRVPRKYMDKLIAEGVKTFGSVVVHAEYKKTERCDLRCVQAKGDECVCSCQGRNHAGGSSAWSQLAGDTSIINEDVVLVTRRFE